MLQFFAINMDNLMDSFLIMGQGMAGIFVVLIVIALLVSLMSKITNRKTDKEK